ncbi:MAG: IS200/IS605 family element transposase accessory protein TnpB [Moorea sp. SIOASIH]|uniref:RNA-guided endonuclease InsQ/TnpB family protein n=1 Tax=Moorena sp. SIOASIH TaxID=2607817 RepID=UPI0013BDC294|nr:transposase [Moorena sp. SIOASIH]NEO40812.1 IS200/IS605 family element transposase accessory protein TnpB [Moorena sp. SIOASIH]
MILSYIYKLRPSGSQSDKMESWLNMLRSHFNWCLADRIETYHQQFIQGAYCSLRTKAEADPLTCCIVKNGATGNPWQNSGKKRNAGTIQDAGLVELKAARPWYKSIDSDVLQRNVARLNTAYQNFFDGRGFPKFKNRSNFRSFEYKPRRVKFNENKVYLPKIGWMRFFNSRPIPNGFAVRSVTIRKKTDGWFMSVRLEDKSIPLPPVLPTFEIKTAVGLDMGLIKLVHCSDGSDIPNPRFATNKKTKRTLKKRQRRLSRTKKGSRNRNKRVAQVAKLHLIIANRRNAYQWQVANKLVKKADAIVVENLNIKGMVKRCKPKREENTGRFVSNGQAAKRGLNRSILDASWGELIAKIEYLAAKSGKVLLKVNPRHTSMECSACGHIDQANRDRERFICTKCSHIDHADKQAARNIKQKAVVEYGLKLIKVRRDSAEPKQLSLFETPSTESTVAIRRQSGADKGKRRVPGNLARQLELFSQDI